MDNFLNIVERVLQFYDRFEMEINDDADVPEGLILSRSVLHELYNELANSSAIRAIPPGKKVKLLGALELTIRGANQVSLMAEVGKCS